MSSQVLRLRHSPTPDLSWGLQGKGPGQSGQEAFRPGLDLPSPQPFLTKDLTVKGGQQVKGCGPAAPQICCVIWTNCSPNPCSTVEAVQLGV